MRGFQIFKSVLSLSQLLLDHSKKSNEFFLFFFVFFILNSLERTSQMMQIYQKHIFCFFFCFVAIFYYFFQKLGSNRCSLFTMLMKQYLINVFHSELVKKKCLSNLLGGSTHLKIFFLKENNLIIMGDLSLLKLKIWSIFLGNLSTHTHSGLFSWVTAHFKFKH